MGLARRIPWQLPKNLNPIEKKRCIQLLIPDDDEYERLLYNFIYDNACLTWMSWQRDGTRNGQNQVELWRRVLGTWTHCDVENVVTYVSEEDDFMPTFKQECIGGVFTLSVLECACPEKWAIIFPPQNVPPPAFPAGSQPTPGGSQQYCNTLFANQQLRLPPTVNSGDTVTLDSATGGWYDGGGGVWNCPDGRTYLATDCVGFGGPVSGDPVPGADHMTVIIFVNTTAYPLVVGTPFTIPSGYTNATLTLQCNDSDISNNSGSVQICATVKNNAAVTWSHDSDFTLTNDGFILSSGDTAPHRPVNGTWQAGVGFSSTSNSFVGSPPGEYTQVGIIRPLMGAFTVTKIEITFFSTKPKDGGDREIDWGAGSNVTITDGSGDQTFTDTTVQTSPTSVDIYVSTSEPPGTDAGTITIMSAHFEGTGTNPFL